MPPLRLTTRAQTTLLLLQLIAVAMVCWYRLVLVTKFHYSYTSRTPPPPTPPSFSSYPSPTTSSFSSYPSPTTPSVSSSSSSSSSSSPSLEQRKVHVLLVSSWRSGSSFVGEVFNQHPSVFYLDEPAFHVWRAKSGQSGARGLRTAVRDLLHQVLRCNVSAMSPYLPPSPSVTNLFRWSHSRALCSPPACGVTPRGAFSDEAKCRRCHRDRDLASAGEACRSYSHVALKVVRVLELESLYPLLTDASLDLRVVHLVRDPRAVWHSRSSGGFPLDNAVVLEKPGVGQGVGQGTDAALRVMREVCRSHLRVVKAALLDPPDFLRGRYMLVRYEDVMRDPERQVETIYRFAGLEMTQPLQGWIHGMTHGKSTGGGGFQVTPRNAEVVSRAWRTKLPFEDVGLIQGVCAEAMQLLGYRAVDSKKQQDQLEEDTLEPVLINGLPYQAISQSTTG